MKELKSSFVNGFAVAVKANFLIFTGWFVFFVIASALLASFFSGRQSSVVAMDVGFSIIKLCYPVFLFLLIQEVFFNEIAKKFFLNTLSFPISRLAWFLGRFGAVFSLILFAILFSAFALMLLGEFLLSSSSEDFLGNFIGWGYLLSVLLLVVEALVVTAVGGFLLLFSTTPGFLLVGIVGFAVFARSVGYVLELIRLSPEAINDSEDYESGLSMLGYVFPDLGRLDIREAFLYGENAVINVDLLVSVFACLLFFLGILALSAFIFEKKRFS